jgi:hypothetical protein
LVATACNRRTSISRDRNRSTSVFRLVWHTLYRHARAALQKLCFQISRTTTFLSWTRKARWEMRLTLVCGVVSSVVWVQPQKPRV